MPKDAIKKYLEEQALIELAADAPVVEDGHTIAVHYIGRLNDSEVFDTSHEHIAKAAGKHHPQRDYTSWLSFEVGAGQMIAGFDKGVVGMRLWETKTVTIPAVDAYGEYNEALMMEVPLSQLPPKKGWFVAGDQLFTQAGHRLTIKEVTEKHVVIDQNHELAGKDLIFDITIIKIG